MANGHDEINKFILDGLSRIEKKMDDGFKNLWSTSNENATQIQSLATTLSTGCPYKHTELKSEVLSTVMAEIDKRDRKRLAWAKIIGGSGSLLIAWEIIKYIFHIKR